MDPLPLPPPRRTLSAVGRHGGLSPPGEGWRVRAAAAMEIAFVTKTPQADYYHVHLESGEVFGYVPPTAAGVRDRGPASSSLTFNQAMHQGLLFHGRRQATLQAQLVWMEWVMDPSAGPCPAYVVRDMEGPILVIRGYESLVL